MNNEDDEDTTDDPTTENSHLYVDDELETDPIGNDTPNACENPTIDSSHNELEFEAIDDNFLIEPENHSDENIAQPTDATNEQSFHRPLTRRVHFQDPLETRTTRNLRPRNSFRKPAWMSNYELDPSE
jgi:hypothetical protein